MRFSYSAVWDDAVALMRANYPLLAAVAGAFIFLPSLLLSHFLPQPAPPADPPGQARAMIDYAGTNWPWLLPAALVTMAGTIAIFALLLDPARPTVGRAILRSLRVLPIYLIALAILAVAFLVGAVLLSLPFALLGAAGLRIFAAAGSIAIMVALFYYSGRMIVLTPILVAEDERNPLQGIRRSLRLTTGAGWGIAGLLVLILLVFGIVLSAVTFALGSILMLVLDKALADLILLIVNSAVNALAALFLTVLAAAIYRGVAGSGLSRGSLN